MQMTSAELDQRLDVTVDPDADPADVDQALAKFLLAFVRSNKSRPSSAAPAAASRATAPTTKTTPQARRDAGHGFTTVSRHTHRRADMATYTLLDPSVPAGAYDAIFVGTEKKAFKFGDRLIWQFEVEGGEHDGRTVNAFSGTLPTLRSNCGKFLAMLVGSTPEKDRSIDPDDCIGHQYRIRIEESAGGESTRVVAFELLASDQAPAEANDPPALPSDKVPF